MVLIDCHVHLSDKQFEEDLETVVLNCENDDIFAVAVGMSYSDFPQVLDIAQRFNNVSYGLGLHPIQHGIIDKKPLKEEDTVELSQWLKKYSSSAVCLGECGLDFSRWLCPSSLERDGQRSALINQIQLSKQFNLPLNLHSRSAGKPLLDLLRANDVSPTLLHAFDGGKKAIRQGVSDGHYFSVAPSIVRDPSQQLVATSVPRDRVVLESDSPGLGPVKGQRNSPLNLSITVDALAKLWDCSKEDVADITTQNALRLFPKLKNVVRL